MNLRNKTPFYTLFNPKPLNKRQLPTYIDILSYYLYLSDVNTNYKVILKSIPSDIIYIWESASLPHVGPKVVYNKLKKYIDNVLYIKKSQHKSHFKKTVEKHIQNYNILFDICSCKCDTYCKCPRQKQVPPIERSFLDDQRTKRIEFIVLDRLYSTSQQSRTRYETGEPIPSCSNIRHDTSPEVHNEPELVYFNRNYIVNIFSIILNY